MPPKYFNIFKYFRPLTTSTKWAIYNNVKQQQYAREKQYVYEYIMEWKLHILVHI